MTYTHGHQVETVVINWRRPRNVAAIVRQLKRQSLPCTVTVCDCHQQPEYALPPEAFPFIDRLYRWEHNLGAFSRYVPLGAYDHKYTFLLDDDLLPGRRCVEHFWSHARDLGVFGALGQLGRIVAPDGAYHASDVARTATFTEVDVLVRAFFVTSAALPHVLRVRALLGASHDPEDDILLAAGLGLHGRLASYLTPDDPDPQTRVNHRELPSPHARYSRPGHRSARTAHVRAAIDVGWQPLAVRQAAPAPGGSRGVLYFAAGRRHRGLALASITSLRRYGYDGAVRVVSDEPGWLPGDLGCELVLEPQAPTGLGSRRVKTQMVRHAFDITLYLDADAMPISPVDDIWPLLGGSDLAMAADVHTSVAETVRQNRHRDPWQELPWRDELQLMLRLGLSEAPVFNSGVMLFRRTLAVQRLFAAWHEEWLCYRRRDQMALVRAAALVGTTIRTLPGAWNSQPRYYASIRDARNAGVRVLHFLSANRPFLSPELLTDLQDRRMPAGADWELRDLGTSGQRFSSPGRVHAPVPCGGFLAESHDTGRHQLELARPAPSGGIEHYRREVDGPLQSWSGPERSAVNLGRVDALAVVPGARACLEMVVRAGGKLWCCSGGRFPTAPSRGPVVVGDGFDGNPALACVSDRLHLVAPLVDGGVAVLERHSSQLDASWVVVDALAQDLGRVDAVALAVSTLGPAGRLEVVVRVGPHLAHYWRPVAGGRWLGPDFFFSDAAGAPALRQNGYGSQGGFDLLTPARSGGLAHLWRDNDALGQPWIFGAAIDRGVAGIDSVSLLPGEGDQARPADLVAVTLGHEPRWYWRQDRLRRQWLSVGLGIPALARS